MGADTKGKHEISVSLFERARVFADDVEQSVTIGESQHAFQAGLLDRAQITPIGDLITGKALGRTGADDITIFDGTGVGLQDVAAARLAVELCRARGAAVNILEIL